MLDADDIADLEGWAGRLLSDADSLDDVPRLAHVCHRLTGLAPRWAHIASEARLVGDQVELRHGLDPARARWLLGHELAEWAHRRAGYVRHDLEARCDALGAMLVAPRDAFRRAMRHHGHRVHELARIFHTTQSLALLRVGEVSGRPVMLRRPTGAIARGEPYVWPSGPELLALAHPLRITDEPDRVGFMVARSAWPHSS
jgi:hypothetical protein